MSTLPICLTCATQYAAPRDNCPICEDERQYVPPSGQQWTDLETLRTGAFTGVIRPEGELSAIGTEPKVGIGQRALLVPGGAGNVLWDCVPYLDAELERQLRNLGGLTAIAISHPHYYTTMVEWAHAFDVPVYLHENDRQWVGRPDPAIEFWSGTTHSLGDGLTLINLGVHFAGGTVLHWRDGADGEGALLSGDIVQKIPDRRFVAFMYSYPNLIPERPSVVARAAELLANYRFTALYGAWWDSVLPTGAHDIVQRSAKRYLEHITG